MSIHRLMMEGRSRPMRVLLGLAVLAVLAGPTSALVDYCSVNTFASNSTWLQLTKEVSSTEYGVVKKFKSLHCCAKGYRSIEWYKDERAYPWPGGVSSFILYPEAANQTVYTTLAADSDRGNYTCLLRNDTHIHVHTIMLALVEKPPPAPQATYIPQDQWVELGHPVRLYCEAFVGRIELPDASSDVSWQRVYPAGTPPRPNRLFQKKYPREDGQILGAYLLINSMRSEDYGEYVCTIKNGDSNIDMSTWLHHKVTGPEMQNNSVPWRSLCLMAIGAILAMLTAGVLYARFGLRLALSCRNASLTSNDHDKEYDVLVLYTEIDAPLTQGYLIPTMQNKYQYKCINCQLPNDNANWVQVVGRLPTMCRAVVAVVSPEQHTAAQLTAALVQLHTLSPATSPIVVLLQEIPKVQPNVKDSNGENLLTMLRKTRLVPWKYLKDKNFWLGLQLSLPPPISSSLRGKKHRSEQAFSAAATAETGPTLAV